MKWHGKLCDVIIEPVYKRKVKRNALIRLVGTEELLIVPRRALKKGGLK